MDLLKRSISPILPAAWDLIDQEAERVLRLHLAGRKLVDFAGPFGWQHAAVNTGDLRPIDHDPASGVAAGIRVVRPLVELRVPFRLSLASLDAVGRGAVDPDLNEVVRAAEQIARVEDGAIFSGLASAGIEGILTASPHAPVVVAASTAWPRAVASAKEALRAAGINGPYALALGPKPYDEVTGASDEGYPLVDRVERQLGGGRVVWAPALEGAVLLSARGGDFVLTVGEDLSIGYVAHDAEAVALFLTESFTFRVLEPDAAVPLRRG